MDSRDERSNSTSSASSAGSGGTSARRGSGPLFASLHAHRGSDDPRVMARRQSLSEQRPSAGFFGQMWNSWVRGDSPNKK
ncbi:hypothetical protein NKR23_g24 [Pleurostoma richardsiae]|uniref:Conidiation-specific protein 8 n=1 Tax=Pleurostoma richardsiae TaxID=41990 RepID=A0AA38RVG0_9PEZI|nr:hypothetical protein NKR23_g24 [Pleurostoma richardsiae]